MRLSDKLRTQTQKYHKQTEKALKSDRIMSPDFSLEEYKELIYILTAFHFIYENEVHQKSAGLLQIDFSKRKKVPLLMKDAHLLGLTFEFLPVKPKAISKFDAIGWSYVMEGATLGGQMIVRSLMNNDHISTPDSLNYYRGYEDKTGYYWKEFKNALDSLLLPQEDHIFKITAGAKKAFEELIIFSSIYGESFNS